MKDRGEESEKPPKKKINEIIWDSFKSQTATWFVGFFIAIMTVFSSQIVESVKFSINRAQLRTTHHEEIAVEVSRYIFWAELNAEFIENGWTKKPTLENILPRYNESVVLLREKEFVYLAWIDRYWGDEELELFDSFMQSVHDFDSAIHSLNDEIIAVGRDGTQERIDPERAEEALVVMQPALNNLRIQGRELLSSLR